VIPLALLSYCVKNEGELSNLQNILVDIMIVLVFLSTVLCTAVFIYLIQNVDVIDALSFTVVLMVASIPLAIEIVTTTTLALGSKGGTPHILSLL
jgi:H+-transporting ATPase